RRRLRGHGDRDPLRAQDRHALLLPAAHVHAPVEAQRSPELPQPHAIGISGSRRGALDWLRPPGRRTIEPPEERRAYPAEATSVSTLRFDHPAEEENALRPVVDDEEQERVVGAEEGGLSGDHRYSGAHRDAGCGGRFGSLLIHIHRGSETGTRLVPRLGWPALRTGAKRVRG